MTAEDVLAKAFSRAEKVINSKTQDKFPDVIKVNIDILVAKIDSNKSLLSAIVTSLVKKILAPKQDIRLHRTDFRGGYSARSLDTSATAPFFKQHFPRYANKESAFLTLATREKIKWNLTDGKNLKIRDKAVKNSFLQIFEAVQSGAGKPFDCLVYIFVKLKNLSLAEDEIFGDDTAFDECTNIVNINTIIKMLETHFQTERSSRLPVIAIYSVYQLLMKNIKRYEDKRLSPLNVHTSSDKHGFGDVEIWHCDNKPFEMVEIKHNIPIDRNLIFDAAKKAKDTSIKRYYILTTYKDTFASNQEADFVNKFILKIKKDSELEIIANGIIGSLKYYFRFIDDYAAYVETYTKNLLEDFKRSTEVKNFHIEKWQEILETYGIK